MALSPFKIPQSSLNRSRSSSCSSPVRNRIVYQEVFSIGPNTLVRSYSCDQVFDKDGSGRTFQTTQIQVSSFVTPEKKFHAKPEESKGARTKALEFPANPSNSSEGKPQPAEQPIPQKFFRETMLFTLLTVTSACALFFYASFRERNCTWDLESTEIDLQQHIFGQNKALEKISSVLKMSNSTKDTHIMVLTGGVGVGKTYASSIISRNFPLSSKKLITYSDYFSEDVEKLKNQNLSSCGCNLVIVDDLSVSSVKEVVDLVVMLHNKKKSDENLLIILIFQTLTELDRAEIVSQLKKTFLNIDYVLFQPLTKAEVEKCFQSEITRQGVMILKSELDRLVEDKMKYVDVVKGPTGCKGVAVDVASYFEKTTG